MRTPLLAPPPPSFPFSVFFACESERQVTEARSIGRAFRKPLAEKVELEGGSATSLAVAHAC